MSYWHVYFLLLPFGLAIGVVLFGLALRAHLQGRRRR